MSQVFTVDDVAKLLRCDPDTVAIYLKNGDIPGLKIGRGWVVPAEAFFQRLNEWALDEAATRRAGRESLTAISRTGALPSMAIVNTSSGKRGRPRREPPDLTKLTQLKGRG